MTIGGKRVQPLSTGSSEPAAAEELANPEVDLMSVFHIEYTDAGDFNDQNVNLGTSWKIQIIITLIQLDKRTLQIIEEAYTI